MRHILLASAVLGALLAPAAQAQLKLQVNKADPLTNLGPSEWVDLVTRIVDPASIVGKDAVYVVNATGEPILALTCRSYQLIGAKPYITSNGTTAAPATLPAWKVSIVPTEGFNTYCKDGLDAIGATRSFHVAVPKSGFQNLTFLIIKD